MKRWLTRFSLFLLCWLAFPQRCPAPLIYTPGEGWHYEQAGGEGSWIRQTAKEQLDVAQTAFDKQDFSTAIKAANRIVSHDKWRFGDYAPRAQYLLGRCYEAKGNDEKAFKVYEQLLKEYPKVENYEEIVTREFMIANRYLAGKFFRVWGYIPLYRSMDKTIVMYEKVIKNGPYSDVAPQAQMNIGLAHLSKKGLFVDIPEYEDKKVGADALFEEAMAYTRQARRAEYDQSIAAQAISTFTEFIASHPEDSRLNEAQKTIDSLKTEQARGSYDIARFYEQKRRWRGALIYYNEVLLKDPGSSYAKLALLRIDDIIKNHGAQP
jgi:outer membrane protein assembly factor BamD (BamD/ComL family)